VSKKDSKKKPPATSKKDPEKTPLLPTRVNYILIIGVLVLCEVTGVRADVHLLEQPGNLSDHSESIQKKFQLMKEHVNKIGVDSDPIGSWLRGLFGGIGEWAVHLLKGLLLGLVVILLLVVCLPCLLQFVTSSIRRIINSSISYHTEYRKMQGGAV